MWRLQIDNMFIDRVFVFDGTDTWTDEDGVEWNEAVK